MGMSACHSLVRFPNHYFCQLKNLTSHYPKTWFILHNFVAFQKVSLLKLVQNPNVITDSKCVCRPWSTDVSNKAETTERGYIVPLDELTQQAGCLNEKVKAREVSTPTILTS